MAWYVYLAYFFGGALFANGVPPFVSGISGNNFQSPFARPPGVGESSALVNVIWGMANFLVGYLLLNGVGDFRGGLGPDFLVAGLGFALMAIGLAWHFGRVRYNNGTKPE